MAKLIQFGGEVLRAMELQNGGIGVVCTSDFKVGTAVNIGTAAAESAEVDCGEGMRLVGYSIDSALIGTSMTYKVGHTAGTRQALYNDAGAVTHTVAAAKNVTLPVADFYPWRYVSFVAGTVQGGTVCAITPILASI